MDACSWQLLFNSFRPDDHDSLVLSVSGGLEVAVQNVSRVEDDLVLVRGRISGQEDGGRLFIIPYSKLNSVFVNRVVAHEEVELFSPTVSPERKEQVAALVADLANKVKEEAQDAEKSMRNERNGNTLNLKEQLERLREQAGFGGPTPLAAKTAAAPGLIPAHSTPQTNSAPSRQAPPPASYSMPASSIPQANPNAQTTPGLPANLGQNGALTGMTPRKTIPRAPVRPGG